MTRILLRYAQQGLADGGSRARTRLTRCLNVARRLSAARFGHGAGDHPEGEVMVEIAAGGKAGPGPKARTGRRRASGIYGAIITVAILATAGTSCTPIRSWSRS